MRKASEVSELSGTSKDKSTFSLVNSIKLELRRSERFKNKPLPNTKNSLEALRNVFYNFLYIS